MHPMHPTYECIINSIIHPTVSPALKTVQMAWGCGGWRGEDSRRDVAHDPALVGGEQNTEEEGQHCAGDHRLEASGHQPARAI